MKYLKNIAFLAFTAMPQFVSALEIPGSSFMSGP